MFNSHAILFHGERPWDCSNLLRSLCGLSVSTQETANLDAQPLPRGFVTDAHRAGANRLENQ